MIIIKQEGGNVVFLNEKEYVRVDYIPAEALVVTKPKDCAPVAMSAHVHDLEHVESVEYVNQAQPAKYTFTAPKLKGAYDDELVKEALFDEIDRLDTAERDRRKGNGQAACKSGSADRFLNVCEAHDIKTVGQLLYVGRRDFERYRKMGRCCVDSVSQALKNLYDIDF